jgi:hypothetical protein
MWSGPNDRPPTAGANPVEDIELLADAEAPDFVDGG